MWELKLLPSQGLPESNLGLCRADAAGRIVCCCCWSYIESHNPAIWSLRGSRSYSHRTDTVQNHAKVIQITRPFARKILIIICIYSTYSILFYSILRTPFSLTIRRRCLYGSQRHPRVQSPPQQQSAQQQRVVLHIPLQAGQDGVTGAPRLHSASRHAGIPLEGQQ